MRTFIFLLVISVLTNFTIFGADKNDFNLILNKVIPRYRVEGTLKKALYHLKEESISSYPGPKLNIVYFAPDDFDQFDEEVDAKPLVIKVETEGLKVIEIIKNLCEAFNVRYKIENNVVNIFHPSFVTETLTTCFYRLSISDLKKLEGDGAQKFLESQGIAFNTYTSAKYISSINRVAVINSETEQAKVALCFTKFDINEKLGAIKESLLAKEIKSATIKEILAKLNSIDDKLNKLSQKKAEPLAKNRLEQQLRVTIPKVRFIDRDLDFFVDFIRRVTRDLDKEGESLNVFITADVKGFKKRINIDLDDVSVQDVIRFSLKKVGLMFKIEGDSIFIGKKIKDVDEVKFYETSESFLKYVRDQNKNNFKVALTSLGVSFSIGSSISYVKNVQRIAISNKLKEHTKISEIMKFFNLKNP